MKFRRQSLGFGLVMAGVLMLGSLSLTNRSDAFTSNTSTLDLITNQDWAHLAGATQTNGGVQISPLGRAIVNQNGSDNQTNPPVNVRGPELTFSKDITVNLKATSIPKTGTASFYIYSAVPVIYDEWRYQPAQLRLDFSQDKVTAYEWNGHSDKPNFTQSWSTNVGNGAYISVSASKKDNNLSIVINGTKLATINAKKIFNSGQMWLGADASLDSGGWTIKSLSADGPSGKMSIAVNNAAAAAVANSLRSLTSASSRKLPIGSAVSNYALFSDKNYQQLVTSQINMLIPENELKPQFVHPQPNVYSFTEADSLVDFALANGMTVHGHTLEFSEANPKWMQNSALADRQQILTDHITTVVSHYGSKINEWDVVDEPLNDNDDNHGNSRDLRKNIWTAAMGENYIDVAFNAAHTANPNAKLYINEYGLEADGSRWDEFISLLKRLQARGVPIDGVGFQAHVHEEGDEVDVATLQKHIQTLANMGLSSRISEMDVYGDDAQHQADQFAAGLTACEISPTCTSFTMWGLTDKYGSTTDIHNYPLSYGNDLVWDENIHPKLAYNSLANVIKAH